LIFFLLFIAIPISELFFLIYLSSIIGFWYTLLIVFLTGIVGFKLMKSQGRSILGSIQTRMAQGEIPTFDMVQGLLIMAAGILLITPGIFTDITGFILLIPFTRPILAKLLIKYFKNKIEIHQFGNIPNGFNNMSGDFNQDPWSQPNPHSENRIIDADWEEEKDDED
jgi:UPF0716 protein FxsA